MDDSQFRKVIQSTLTVELPSISSLFQEARSIANNIKIGRTAFMDKMGVESEAEYKKQCIRDKTIMYHAHIGMSTWKDTAEALVHISRAAENEGFSIDRAGICLDRRMGLPKEYRNKVPAETGPMLETVEEWAAVGRAAPIQPHMGDFMIGFPASTENTVNALKAGVTTIGNLSQFFAHEVPGWRDTQKTAIETVKALIIMSELRPRGTLIHSYLEDGFGAHFQDCATIAGWTYLERYIVEELLGGKLSHCIGGLTEDPVKRAGWVFALDEIHDHESLGSMFYGDTISFTQNLAFNQGIVAEYLMWDIMAQLTCPTGHSVLPIPVTEAFRVPSAQEIAEVQSFGRRVEKAARRMLPYVNLNEARSFSNKAVSIGKKIFNRALEGMKDAGVDIQNPLQLLYVLKKLGPALFERSFGEGEADETISHGRNPRLPTGIYTMSRDILEIHRKDLSQRGMKKNLQGRRFLIASTDVHGFAVELIHQLLSEAGAEMIKLGAEKNPDDVVQAAQANKVDGILLSTHNGLALEYAQRLKQELAGAGLNLPILMGGVLNQKFEDSVLPVDVTENIRELGFFASPQLKGGLNQLLSSGMDIPEED
jgi:methylmalonyl-CoA mutase cobalamin-binding subunit